MEPMLRPTPPSCPTTSEKPAVMGTEKLVHYSLLAGDQALAAYADVEAASHLEGRPLAPLSQAKHPQVVEEHLRSVRFHNVQSDNTHPARTVAGIGMTSNQLIVDVKLEPGALSHHT